MSTSRSTRYVAFLRSINIGGRRVKMDELRALFEALKFAEVSTFIASGNVIFRDASTDGASIERRIEDHLQRTLGYPVATFVRTTAELASAAALRPFPDAELDAPGRSLHVGFLRSPLSEVETSHLLSFRTAMDDFHVAGRELYWLCRGRVLDSLVSWQAVTKLVPTPSTMRNVTTVRKLAALYPPE
jgi:uncharacterized protein (DUF1697 family)